jgi:hypothetical protein
MHPIISEKKARAFASALRNLRLPEKSPDVVLQTPDDELQRIVLCSTEVKREIYRYLRYECSYVRLAFERQESPDSGVLPQLEVYDASGRLVEGPATLPQLPDPLAYAVEVEVFQMLLKDKGVDISLW